MWTLRGFDRATDELITERVMPRVTLDDVRASWRLAPEDPGYDSYPVTRERLSWIVSHLGGAAIDLDRFDYFLEFDAEDEDRWSPLRLDEGASEPA